MELKKYWKILLGKKWIILFSTLLAPSLIFLTFILSPTVYQSKAKLLIRTKNFQQLFVRRVPGQTFGEFTYTDPDKLMNTIEETIENSVVLGKTIRTLNLRDANGEPLKIGDFLDPNFLTLLMKGKGVSIENISVTEIFELRGYSRDASEAKLIADEVISNFRTELYHMYRDDVFAVRTVLEKRIEDVNSRRGEAEKALASFKSQVQLYRTPPEIDFLIADINNAKTERDKIRRSLEVTGASLKNLEEGRWVGQYKIQDVIINIEQSAVLDGYKAKLLEMKTKLAELKIDKTEEHPDVKMIKQQIEVVEDNIKKEVSQNLAAFIGGHPAAMERISQKYADNIIAMAELRAAESILSKQIENKEARLREFPEQERKLNNLTVEVDALKQTYNMTLADLEAVKSAAGMDLANAIVIQPAAVGELYFPPVLEDYPIFLGIGAGAGMLFGIFFAFLLNYLSVTLNSREDIEKFLEQEVVISMPRVRRSHLPVTREGESPFAESIRNFFSLCNLFDRKITGQIISVVSTARGDGKSTLTVHIGQVLARRGTRALLIDGNLRNPVLHNAFGLKRDNGLSEYLTGKAEVGDICKKTFENNLDIITSGLPHIKNLQEVSETEKLALLFETLRGSYEVIIVDTPSFSEGYDGLLVSSLTKRTILVVRQGKTLQKSAKEWKDILGKAKVAVLGTFVR